MARASHVPDSELIGFADREIGGNRATAIEAHVEECAQCRARLANLQNAAGLYEQFHHQVLKPGLALPDAGWPRLELSNKAGASARRSFAKPAVRWVGALAAACLVFMALYFRGESQGREMRQLLAQAADAPARPHRKIQLSVAGRTWYRPALLRNGGNAAGLEHVQALFVKANYSWEDPLSARSFAAWRNGLRAKRDHVTSVGGADGLRRLYRLRTETADGVLRMASLTLRANDLMAVDGAFEFENQERVTMADTGQDSNDVAGNETRPRAKRNLQPPNATEQKVSAADELRVLAALDEIGADVGEPVKVETDNAKQHVVVTGMGIAAAREREIREALAAVPNTVVRFDSEQAPPQAGAQTRTNTAPYSADVSAPFRHILEDRAGGVQQLQLITDRALDASNSLLARAHALLVLAQKFPPDVEASFDDAERATLRKLRHRHAVAIEQTTLELEEAFKPLLKEPAGNPADSGGTRDEPNASWQGEAAKLFERVRALDQSVTRLLAANDSQQAGESILSQLPKDVENVEALARWQANAE